MKKFAFALAATLVAAAAPTAASAAPVINYTPNVGATFGNDDPAVYPPLFSDVYTFVTDYARNATVDITSFMSTPTAFPENVNFVSNGVKLNAKIIPATSTGQFEQRYLANFRIPAGVQNIFVNGSAGVNGAYSGILTLSGVPEPTTWALMILGFGLTGAAMRRRRAVSTKVSFA